MIKKIQLHPATSSYIQLHPATSSYIQLHPATSSYIQLLPATILAYAGSQKLRLLFTTYDYERNGLADGLLAWLIPVIELLLAAGLGNLAISCGNSRRSSYLYVICKSHDCAVVYWHSCGCLGSFETDGRTMLGIDFCCLACIHSCQFAAFLYRNRLSVGLNLCLIPVGTILFLIFPNFSDDATSAFDPSPLRATTVLLDRTPVTPDFHCVVNLQNRSSKKIEITEFLFPCGCIGYSPKTMVLLPLEKKSLDVVVDLNKAFGGAAALTRSRIVAKCLGPNLEPLGSITLVKGTVFRNMRLMQDRFTVSWEAAASDRHHRTLAVPVDWMDGGPPEHCVATIDGEIATAAISQNAILVNLNPPNQSRVKNQLRLTCARNGVQTSAFAEVESLSLPPARIEFSIESPETSAIPGMGSSTSRMHSCKMTVYDLYGDRIDKIDVDVSVVNESLVKLASNFCGINGVYARVHLIHPCGFEQELIVPL